MSGSGCREQVTGAGCGHGEVLKGFKKLWASLDP